MVLATRAVRLGGVLVTLGRVTMGFSRMLMTGGVVALAVMFGSSAMRLGCLLVMLGGFRMSLLGHRRLHLKSTYVLLFNGFIGEWLPCSQHAGHLNGRVPPKSAPK